jgi:deoxycytidylate deaminase
MSKSDFKPIRRMSKDAYYCSMARVASHRSTCFIRTYGCVIVKNDEIIATGYNGYPRGDACTGERLTTQATTPLAVQSMLSRMRC